MTEDLEIFDLSPGERSSALWGRLKTYLGKKLHDARCHNDDPALSADATAALRGEIKALKAIIALGDEPPIIDGDLGGRR